MPSDTPWDWPFESVLWFVRTALRLHYEKMPRAQQPGASLAEKEEGSGQAHASALEYICAMVDALCSLFRTDGNELGIGAGVDKRGTVERAISIVARTLLYNNEYNDIQPYLVVPSRGASSSDLKSAVEGLSSKIAAQDLLPLLILDSTAEAIGRFLSQEKNLDVNKRNRLFGAPLYNAAITNNSAVLRLLLSTGADPNQTGGRWHTALHASLASPTTTSTESLSLLLTAGADINAQGGGSRNGNRTPIMTASHHENTAAVELLLSQPHLDITRICSYEDSIVNYIARAGDVDNFRKLLELYDSPPPDGGSSSSSSRRPPNGDVDFNALLKNEGLDGTALHSAMNLHRDSLTDGHDAIVEILLARGMSPLRIASGAETSVVGWAEAMRAEAQEEDEEDFKEDELPAAVRRILRWWQEWEELSLEERRATGLLNR
ncbi:ankyrin repeat-containing domain protein [Aspergillus pseudoustus]|uniref:Ankyrin repeat-containing domain protein n=1 Tax=Aspergillus pseudoustus TaxID=1810923 RepID=A0ABR4J0X3_9EURO